MYVPCIYIVYYIHILIIYHVYPEYIPSIYLRYTIHIPGIYIGYTIHMYCICKVYTKDKQCSKYNEYVWYITGISHPDWYMHGIYMVYTWYIPSIWCPHTYVWYIPCKTFMGLFRTFFYIDIRVIYQVYPQDIHGISRYTCYIPLGGWCCGGGQGPIPPDPPAITSPVRVVIFILLHSCTHLGFLLLWMWHSKNIPGIYQVYTRYIQGIYQRLGRGQAAGSRCSPGPGLFIDLPVSPQYFPGIYTL